MSDIFYYGFDTGTSDIMKQKKIAIKLIGKDVPAYSGLVKISKTGIGTQWCGTYIYWCNNPSQNSWVYYGHDRATEKCMKPVVMLTDKKDIGEL